MKIIALMGLSLLVCGCSYSEQHGFRPCDIKMEGYHGAFAQGEAYEDSRESAKNAADYA